MSLRHHRKSTFNVETNKEGRERWKKYEYRKLRGRIVEKYGTNGNFAKALGVSKNTLSLKLNNKCGFSQSDIVQWCELLEIPMTQIADYFFR